MNEVKVGLMATLTVCTIFYIILFITAVGSTYSSMVFDYEHGYDITQCRIKRNIEYVFPVRPVACWLFEERN